MTATTYTVTVTDHAANETHTASEQFTDLQTAKAEADYMLHSIYRDAPDEVGEAVEELTSRIVRHAGEVVERDDYLDCTVEIVAV